MQLSVIQAASLLHLQTEQALEDLLAHSRQLAALAAAGDAEAAASLTAQAADRGNVDLLVPLTVRSGTCAGRLVL